jgi:PAS domain S-box-containing protein
MGSGANADADPLSEQITVLHVVGDPSVADGTAGPLAALDDQFRVVTETRPEDALERIEAAGIDCVVSDYRLSGTDGLEFLAAVRDDHPDLPFILYTGDGSEAVASDAFSAGATDYVRKAGEADDHRLLARRIESAVEGHRSRKHAALFESASDPIVEVRFEDRVPYIDGVNRAFETVFGFDEDEVIGEQVSDIVVPDTDDDPHDALRERVVQGERVEAVVRRKTASGERDFLLRVVPFDVAEDASGAYAWYIDVTEQREYSHRLETLNEASRRLMTATSEREIAEITVGLARTVLDYPLTAMWSYDRDDDILHPLASERNTVGSDEATADGSLGPIEPDTTEMGVFRDGEMTAIEAYSEIDAPAIADDTPETVLAAPLGDHGQLQIWAAARSEFDEETRDLVEVLCQTAEAAFDRLARERTLGGLNELTRELVRAASEEEIATVAAETGEKILGLPFTHLYLVTDDGETLEPVGVPDDTTERFGDLPRFRRGEGVLWEVFESGEPRLYDDVQEEVELATEMPFRGAVLVPLGDRGVFASGSLEPAEFDPVDRKFASILASTTEVALERAEQDRRLRERTHKLEAARDRFRSVFEHTNDAIVIFDPDADEILEANPRATDLLGYSREELLGMGPSDIHPGEMELFREFVETIHTDGKSRTDRLSCITASGERVPAEISASTLEFEGQESVLASIRDVSDLREYERELERQNERLENFASVISHDLRNPLNVATGRIEMVADDCDSDHIGPVRSALDRIEEMIEDLLTLTRAGESVQDGDWVDLSGIVEGCWGNVETTGADLVATTDVAVYADESRLRNVLENLFRNSIEHTAGDVTVAVGELSDPEREGFYVEDDGPGIPVDERERVFEQGYTTGEDGTGFGLSIVREIVEAHGWEIAVTESATGGARFEITGVE